MARSAPPSDPSQPSMPPPDPCVHMPSGDGGQVEGPSPSTTVSGAAKDEQQQRPSQSQFQQTLNALDLQKHQSQARPPSIANTPRAAPGSSPRDVSRHGVFLRTNPGEGQQDLNSMPPRIRSRSVDP